MKEKERLIDPGQLNGDPGQLNGDPSQLASSKVCFEARPDKHLADSSARSYVLRSQPRIESQFIVHFSDCLDSSR